jgi:AraC family transcriptional regulator, activator of mtrCDE
MDAGVAAGLSVSADALSGLAPLLRVQPELQYVCRFGAQWASAHASEAANWAPFHIVTEGSCLLHLTAEDRSILLQAGDVAVLPHGSAHVVHGPNNRHDAPGPFGIRGQRGGAILIKANTDRKPDTQLVCGRLKFDHAGKNLVLSALPNAIVARAEQGNPAPHARCLTTLVKEELDAARPGAAAIASDLASALLVMVVRTHLEADRGPNTILSLLGHPKAARAVVAMLERPGRAWTLDELAEVANASRASLVRMFRQAAKMSPLAFLAETRLELARRKLLASSSSLAAIAADVGYQSESAFSRAFHVRYGLRPGQARKRVPA